MENVWKKNSFSVRFFLFCFSLDTPSENQSVLHNIYDREVSISVDKSVDCRALIPLFLSWKYLKSVLRLFIDAFTVFLSARKTKTSNNNKKKKQTLT